MTIASILKTKGGDVVAVHREATVQDVSALLHRHRIGAVLVVEGGQPVGVVSERDIVKCLHERGAEILKARAEDIMTSPVVTVSPDESVVGAMAVVTKRRIRHLPVIEHGRLLGIVSIGDLVKRRIEDAEHEAAQLKIYITT